MLVISCHADTGFRSHFLDKRDDKTFYGNLDNFAGVHAVMNAYFSGRMNLDHVRVELTYDEEKDFGGAREVLPTLTEHDLVVVVDVTGTPTDRDILAEKCANPAVRDFVAQALHGMSVKVYEGCDDPVSCFDECDVYVEATPYVFFLGIPCFGGDYNEGCVSCRQSSIPALSEALCRIAEAFPLFCEKEGLPVL